MPAAVVNASVPEKRGFISIIEKLPSERSIPWTLAGPCRPLRSTTSRTIRSISGW
jgi:hypothetical protein